MDASDYLRWIILSMLQFYQQHQNNDAQFSYPGTNWCGPGNTSTNNQSLGFFVATDYCCRQHDSCPMYISAHSAGYGLINNDPYTRLGCNCDETFYRCLRDVRSFPLDNLVAKSVGFVYFTLLEDRCFELTNTSQKHGSSPNCTASGEKYVWRTLPPF